MVELLKALFAVSLSVMVAAVVSSCLPDFRLFDVVDVVDSGDPPEDSSPEDSSAEDGSIEADSSTEDSPSTEDSGELGWNNPIDLGRSCNDPHLAIAVSSRSTSGPGRLLHFNLSEDAPPVECHESLIAKEQRAFGTGVNSVTSMPTDGSEVISVPYAVIALDSQGFPRWRWQPWDDDASPYYYSDVFPLRIQGTWYIGVIHCDSYCYSSYQGILVLDMDGTVVTHVDELPGFGSDLSAAGPNPDGTSTLVMEVDWDPLQVFSLTPTTTQISEEDGENLGSALGFFVSGIGNLYLLESDLYSERFLATYDDAVVPWRSGDPMPTSGLSCDICESYDASAIDPYDDNAFYTLCEIGNNNSLVRMTQQGCDVLVDGTTMSDFNMVDIALVRGTLD